MRPDISLFWCALPLLLLPWLSAPERLGMAASRIVVTGFVLGALQVGTGSLGLAELDSWAAREGNAGFIALTLGVLVSGAAAPMLSPAPLRHWLPGLPLLLVAALLLIRVGPHRALVIGIGLGALPAVVVTLRQRLGPTRTVPRDEPPSSPPCAGGVVGLTVVVFWLVATRGGPIVIVTLGLGGLLLLAGWRARGDGGRTAWPVASVIGAAALAAFAWLTLTVAGEPFVMMRRYAVDAPLSPAAEQWLGSLLVVSMLGTFAPWPWHRLGDARATLPVAIAFTHAAATMVAPEGVRGWLPLLTILLVPSAVLGVLRRQWDGAAGAMAALASVRPGPLAPVAALAVVLWPTLDALRSAARVESLSGERVTFNCIRLGVSSAAVGAALTVAIVLQDEVVLGTILAAGLALVAPLADRLRPPSAGGGQP